MSLMWERRLQSSQFFRHFKLTKKENDSQTAGDRCGKKKIALKDRREHSIRFLRLHRGPEKLKGQGVLHDSSPGGKVD